MPQQIANAIPTVTPNLFNLSGPHLHVSYSPTGLDGKPSMTYQDAHQSKSFKGDEIRTLECDLGTLVSVTIRAMPDVGSTSVSLFIPRMKISPVSAAQVTTDCVTTQHSTPFAVPDAIQGQLDTYTVTNLHGTAQAVVF
ncbi:MAG TPA: hypothetical protein VFK02_32595 [Kofleriaceae bacterium]|nr:hypothetical protein [Kofleriaceae bacterium]